MSWISQIRSDAEELRRGSDPSGRRRSDPGVHRLGGRTGMISAETHGGRPRPQVAADPGGPRRTPARPPAAAVPAVRRPRSGVRVVAAVTADLDLQRRQVVQPTLLHLVAQTLLLLFDHGAPHLLQRGVVLLLHHRLLLLLLLLLRLPVASSSPRRGRGGGQGVGRAAARSGLVASATDVDAAGAESAPQAACRQEVGWGQNTQTDRLPAGGRDRARQVSGNT